MSPGCVQPLRMSFFLLSTAHRGFFLSSRRRHTISLCDWSSDVCSSDLRTKSPTFLSGGCAKKASRWSGPRTAMMARSEEHTSELQSHSDLVCRLLLEKKKRPDDADEVLVRVLRRGEGVPLDGPVRQSGE